MRMFVALRPPESVVDDIEALVAPRRAADDQLRWTPVEQWHVTLAFLPAVGERALDALLERLERAARRTPAFPATVGGAGAFPVVERARVLWLGVRSDPPDLLGLLAARAHAAAAKAGAEVAGGRFTAHITLGRWRQPVDATRWLRIVDAFPPVTWTAGEIELVESHLGQGPGGRPRHEVRATFPLT